MRYKIERTGEVFDPEKRLRERERENFQPPFGGQEEIKITPLGEDGNPIEDETFYRCEVTQEEIDVQIEAGEKVNLNFCYVANLNLGEKHLHGFGARNAFFDGDVSFNHAQFGDGDVRFRGTQFSKGNVSFASAQFGDGNVSFDHAEFGDGEVSFFSAEFGDGEVSFWGAQFGDVGIRFDVAQFGDGGVSFHGTQFGGGYISFNHAQFGDGDVSFDYAQFDGGGVSFDYAQFGENTDLRLISIKAALTWSMSNLVFPAQILTEDCKFKKLALNLCTFTNRVDLRGVDVEETDIRGTDFEKRIVMPSSHKCFGKLANRETANLLKDQALLRNNRIEAVYYHQKEKWYHLKETFPKNVTEWVPNFFNLVTNGYGVNWWLPLPFILLFSLLVYPFCLWLGGGVEWVGFGEGFGAYLSNSLLFLVAPRITVMELGGLPKEALSPFVFYLSRGLLAILYYQLIQAFRRNKPL